MDGYITINASEDNKIIIDDYKYNYEYSSIEYSIYYDDKLIRSGYFDDVINKSFILKAYMLQNGYEYRIVVRCYDNNNDCVFRKISNVICYTVSLKIANIKDIIEDEKYTFRGIFKSSNDIAKIKNYRYWLYDENTKLKKMFRLSTDVTYHDKLLQYVGGLESKKTYYIKFECMDTYGRTHESKLYSFYVDYIPFLLNQVCGLTNNCEEASVLISSTLKRLTFIGVDDWNYLVNEKVDLTRSGWIYMARGFRIEYDFTIQMWGESIQSGVDFLYLQNQTTGDKLRCWYDYDKKRVFCEKTVGKYVMLYRSIEDLEVTYGDKFSIMIQQRDGRIGIYTRNTNEPEDMIVELRTKSDVLLDKMYEGLDGYSKKEEPVIVEGNARSITSIGMIENEKEVIK